MATRTCIPALAFTLLALVGCAATPVAPERLRPTPDPTPRVVVLAADRQFAASTPTCVDDVAARQLGILPDLPVAVGVDASGRHAAGVNGHWITVDPQQLHICALAGVIRRIAPGQWVDTTTGKRTQAGPEWPAFLVLGIATGPDGRSYLWISLPEDHCSGFVPAPVTGAP
jgi:hypothetical protein